MSSRVMAFYIIIIRHRLSENFLILLCGVFKEGQRARERLVFNMSNYSSSHGSRALSTRRLFSFDREKKAVPRVKSTKS